MKHIHELSSRWIAQTAVIALALATSLSAQPALSATEAAVPAQTFVDTIGIVTHFNYERTYRDDSPKVVGLLADSGIRHIRDGFGDAKSRQILAELGTRGVKVDLVTGQGQKMSQIVGYPALLPPGMVDAFEGPNELDIPPGNDAYIAILRSFVPQLYSAVKSDSRTHSIAVIGPSLTRQQSFAAVGDLSAYMDYGNMHNYVWGRNPGTTASDGNHYGSIRFMLSAARNVSGIKPVMTTELGYGTSSKPNEVNERTQLKYLMRAYFEQAANGVARTYVYEFLDDGAKYFNTYGIVRHDLTPKPSYIGLRNLIQLLADLGQGRRDSVDYAVDGPPSVHHYLMEKSDGSFYLALWNEAKNFALGPGGDEREMHVAPATVSLRLNGHVQQMKAFTFDTAGNMSARELTLSGNATSLPITDAVTICEWQGPGI